MAEKLQKVQVWNMSIFFVELQDPGAEFPWRNFLSMKRPQRCAWIKQKSLIFQNSEFVKH